jgi:hypothetical protein
LGDGTFAVINAQQAEIAKERDARELGNADVWEQYGRRMVDSFALHWPREVKLSASTKAQEPIPPPARAEALKAARWWLRLTVVRSLCVLGRAAISRGSLQPARDHASRTWFHVPRPGTCAVKYSSAVSMLQHEVPSLFGRCCRLKYCVRNARPNSDGDGRGMGNSACPAGRVSATRNADGTMTPRCKKRNCFTAT